MPLRAVTESGNLHAFEFDALRWAELKDTYRTLGLGMPCCGVPAVPKTSALGNFFFAHVRKGDCATGPESAEHIYCKMLIAQAAQAAGWLVTTERPGTAPNGNEWTADVFCEKGKAKIAFEVQMSLQSRDETVRRQLRYKESGVRGAWFFGPKNHSQNFVEMNSPAFLLTPVEVGQVPSVQHFNTPLPEFVTAMLNKRLNWTIPQYNKPLFIEYFLDSCWACKKPVKQVYGYLNNAEDTEGEWHERSFTVPGISTALEKVLEVVSNEELIAQGLNFILKRDVIRGKPTHWGYTNACLYCRAPQDNHFVGEKVRVALYGVPGQTKDNDFYCGSPEPEEVDDVPINDAVGVTPIARIFSGGGRWVLDKQL